MRKYIPKEFEEKLAKKWDDEKTYAAPSSFDGKKMYVLDMFPYPSGAGLHVGHPRGYVGSDVLARFYRMQGYSVLHPMGWDAFGLPAENAAIKAKRNPAEITKENIANFTRQLKMLGFSYDWTREIATTDPAYYKWTQWLFIEFFKMGLLYKKMTPVYYCPFCKTAVAQEEVLPNNTHERCQTPIEMRDLPQWIFRITTYADRLVDDLKDLRWPNGILEMQKNWIGRKTGMEITYQVEGTNENITCFTTRPETNLGATFIVLAPEHSFVNKVRQGAVKTAEELKKQIEEYVAKNKSKSELERTMEGKNKTGVFTGLFAVNPLNNRRMPIWVADFVLSGFGTGAVVGVPAYDERDSEFAKAMGLEISNDEISEETTQKLLENGWGVHKKNYHLRDWIFSRQRYWGEPIPMVYCKKCAGENISYWETKNGKEFLETHQNISKVNKEIQKNLVGWFPIDQKTLPLELPYLDSYEPNESGQSPLAKIPEWIKTTCPNCGAPAERESDTMPNWAGSCWYFLRFADPKNDQAPWSEQSLKWLPVDLYIGGAEHAVLHLLYARFWIKAMYDLELINFTEPFLGLKNQGMILAEDHRKMSKSWGNVINPDDVVEEYGADALRVYEMFMAPFNQEIAWSTRSLQGTYRFVKRIWDIFQQTQYFAQTELEEDAKLVSKLNKTISKVTSDITDVKFNTAIAAMMEFLNEWEKPGRKLTLENGKKLLKLVAPFASFTAEEIWSEVLLEKGSIHLSRWPEVDEKSLVETEIKLPVQVNGKMRGVVTVQSNAVEQESVVTEALKDPKILQYVEGKNYKVIYVKAKILNFIV